MKLALPILLSIALASTAHAAWLPSTTVTAPRFEASTTGPDTCAASLVPEPDNMVYRRVAFLPPPSIVSFTDSLVNVAPGASCVSPRLNNVPPGTYTITVTFRDPAGNLSCPESIQRTARGRPAKSGDLGLMLAREQRDKWLAVR